MSVENLKQYGELCAKDEKVRAHAKEIGLRDIDGQIAYGKSLGLEFSREDFEALAKEVKLERKDDLSEEDLKKVAGGIVTSTAAGAAVIIGLMAVSGAVAGTRPGW
jgi:predicted ribosomally synthesized peptide with nif11-like leader